MQHQAVLAGVIAAFALLAATEAHAQMQQRQSEASKAEKMSVCQCVADLLFMAAQLRDMGVPRDDVLKRVSELGGGDLIYLTTTTEATNIAYDMPKMSPAKLKQRHINTCKKNIR
ncbi:hypothetical protein [Cupriavidus sp. CuC1]|uniref:hypothetical protein n=1 Tax=Cupriavidus sp. CuC1 TaxID=3373131 RepID=UPI0037CEDBB1